MDRNASFSYPFFLKTYINDLNYDINNYGFSGACVNPDKFCYYGQR